MWTELDPVANRVNVMNLSLAEARALMASLNNAAHYKRKLGYEPNLAMDYLASQLQLSLYGAPKENAELTGKPVSTTLHTPHT